jgi:hypothetical protein
MAPPAFMVGCLSLTHASSSCALQHEDGKQKYILHLFLVFYSAAWPTSAAKHAGFNLRCSMRRLKQAKALILMRKISRLW